MKALLFASLLSVVAVVPASAQSLTLPTRVFLASAAADWSSTAYCASRGCRETNPLINWAKPMGTPAMVSIGAASDVLTLYVAHRLIGRSHPRVLRVGLYALSAVRVAVAVQNVREARH